jgi:hypothetical protein
VYVPAQLERAVGKALGGHGGRRDRFNGGVATAAAATAAAAAADAAATSAAAAPAAAGVRAAGLQTATRAAGCPAPGRHRHAPPSERQLACPSGAWALHNTSP